ncbi:MAG: hypothetical protein JO016_12085 [Actinobacteria bacterium]|nr:hypothetical protein [Actinomycetota bacterium]
MTGGRAAIATAGAAGLRAGAACLRAGVAALLAGACVAWAAFPLRPAGLAELALVLAVAGAVLGVLRMALASVVAPAEAFASGPERVWARFLRLIRRLPEEEGTVLAVLWLEVQHPARPWYTAGLGVALVAYLLAVHLDESRAAPGVLRRQAPLLAVGACLLAAGAGAAMIPAVGRGSGPDWLRVLASAAAVGAALLVVPVSRLGHRGRAAASPPGGAAGSPGAGR